MSLPLERLGDWAGLSFFRGPAALAVEAGLDSDAREILPPREEIFSAFELTPPEAVRVVILGQDPYPTPGHANGLAFSVKPGVALPKSLANIYRELEDDLGARPPDGDLRFWARQGVLLLNAVLTVPTGVMNGHKGKLGWEDLTGDVIDRVSGRPTAFLLWGKSAQAMTKHIRPGDHLILESPHPSPMSARRGFFGSRPFSKINDWLTARGERAIQWADPEAA